MGLHSAVIEGNLEVVEQHIRAGTDLDIKENSGGSSPLISAALFGKTEIALALIKAGASVNFQNKEGSTPLITAAFFCRTEIVEALLANGADNRVHLHDEFRAGLRHDDPLAALVDAAELARTGAFHSDDLPVLAQNARGHRIGQQPDSFLLGHLQFPGISRDFAP